MAQERDTPVAAWICSRCLPLFSPTKGQKWLGDIRAGQTSLFKSGECFTFCSPGKNNVIQPHAHTPLLGMRDSGALLGAGPESQGRRGGTLALEVARSSVARLRSSCGDGDDTVA